MTGFRRPLARGGAHSMVPLPRQGTARASRGAFGAGPKPKEGTPLPDESFSLEPWGPDPVKVVGMTLRLSEEVKVALLAAQAEGLAVQMKFSGSTRGHVLKIGDQEFPFTSNKENPETYETYAERKTGDEGAKRLVEVGPIVQKLNLQRSLTAAEANKLKQRSVAAEKQMKSRKTVVLEHTSTLDAKQAAPIAKKAVSAVRKPTLKEKLMPAHKRPKGVDTVPSPTATKPPPQPPARSISPAPGPIPPPQSLGPSRLAVSSPPTEPPATGLSPAVNTGPLEQQTSRGSVPPEEGGHARGAKAPPPKSASKRPATNQELKAAIVGVLAGAPENKMRPKSLEKAVQEALNDAGFTKPQFDRVLQSVAAFKSPGFWFLNPDVQKAFAEGRILSSTSPETVAADSPALNIDSPPVAATPPADSEAPSSNEKASRGKSDPTTESADTNGVKAGDAQEARDLREEGGVAAVSEKVAVSEKDAVFEKVAVPERDTTAEKVADPEKVAGSEKKDLGPGGVESVGQASGAKGGERKDEDEAGSDSSSSGSGSGSDSDSDSGSGSSDSSSDDEADSHSEGEAEKGGGGREVNKPREDVGTEASPGELRESVGVPSGVDRRTESRLDNETGLDKEGRLDKESRLGTEKGLDKKSRLGTDNGLDSGEGRAKEGARGDREKGGLIKQGDAVEGEKETGEAAAFQADKSVKPAVEVERIDDGADEAVKSRERSDGHVAKTDGQDRKRKESGGREDAAKKRRVDERALEDWELPGSIVSDRVEKRSERLETDATKCPGGPRAERETVKKTGKSVLGKKLGGGDKKTIGDEKKETGDETKKRKVPKGNGTEEGLAERKESHAAAGPSVSDDARNNAAMSKYKAASDKIAEQKASRKAIALELTDQTALDRRKGAKDGVTGTKDGLKRLREGLKGVKDRKDGLKGLRDGGKGLRNGVTGELKRPFSGTAGGVSKLVKGSVAKTGSQNSKSGAPGGVSRLVERERSSTPLARAHIEKLDDFGDQSPPKTLSGSPKSGERKRRVEELPASNKKAKTGRDEGVKASVSAEKGVKAPVERGSGFGKSSLEEGELEATPQKTRPAEQRRENPASERTGKGSGEKSGEKSSGEKGTKSSSVQGAKPAAKNGVKVRGENGVKSNTSAKKVGLEKSGLEKKGLKAGSRPGSVKKPESQGTGKGTQGDAKQGGKKGLESKGGSKKVPSAKAAENGVQRKGPSNAGKDLHASNGLRSANGNGSAQNGKVKRIGITNGVNGTGKVAEQEWLKYADAPRMSGDRTIDNREQYDATVAEFSAMWPVYIYMARVLEEQRLQFLAYDEQITAARKTHDEQQLQELELKLRVDYNKVKKVHKRMRQAFATLHHNLSVLKPLIKAYASDHGLLIGGST